MSWIRKRDHTVFSGAASLGICGLLAGIVVSAAAFPAVAMSGLAAKAGAETFDRLPTELTVQRAPQNTYLYASDNRTLVAMIYDENRKDVEINDIPPVMRNAIIAAEDHNFYRHNGVDMKGIARAFVNNKSGASPQGASTLTMQYVRMAISYSATRPADVVRATEDTSARKLREMRYAMQVEKEMSKDQILERYLNIAPFGNGAYGVSAASQVYFSKPPKDLNTEEAAMLAGMVKAPSAFDPTTETGRPLALSRRNYVIDNMTEIGAVTPAEAARAKAAELTVNGTRTPNGCVNSSHNEWGYFCDYVYRWWMEQDEFGDTPYDRERRLKSGGYRIVTSMSVKTQDAARKHVHKRAADGNRNAIMVAAVEPGTGRVQALAVNRVYKNDDAHNEPNSDPVKRRNGLKGTYPNTTNPVITGSADVHGYQGGSVFKMFALVAALEKGYPLSYSIYAPETYHSRYVVAASSPAACPGRALYCPKNAVKSMAGVHNMWSAFGASVNTYFIPLQERAGAENAVDVAKRLGIKFRAENDARFAGDEDAASQWGAFALGVSSTTPLDLANAYATLAADGRHCEPIPVIEIRQEGKPLPAAAPRCNQAVAKDVARAAIDAARCPVGDRSETSRCRGATAAYVRRAVGHPVAGKSGTTDGERTATFVATTKQLTVAGMVADTDNANTTMRGGGDGWGNPHTEAVNPAVYLTLADAMENVEPEDFTPPSQRMINGKQVNIPNVRCDSEPDARTRLIARGFEVQVAAGRWDSHCPAGTVASTEPGGSTIEGGVVVLRLSTGRSSRPVPPSSSASASPPPR
ncbi:membrane peptidoglycan carboxypeptidase [Catenuloplanes nepalensis]|uniref:Membrane peptidoglycan carboxypeptidase n=1 Tax=Catenuloplanes nepalensis TaxID=587533 RepID=A0ABT9N3J0_9ACTN|nr:membrane peptidoglycan carboxypeptidase [Catenuloplanes nepalensis]